MTATQAVQLTGILGVIAPLFISFLNQSHWSTQVKQIVAVVVAGLIGVIVAVTSGLPLTFDNVAALVGLAIGASQLAYTFLWKPTTVAPKIEAATTTKVDNTGVTVVDADGHPDADALAGASIPDPTDSGDDEPDFPDPTK